MEFLRLIPFLILPVLAKMPPLITLEEHYLSSATPDAMKGLFKEQVKFVPNIMEKLKNLSSLRLADMDKGDVTLQVVSHAAGLGSYPANYSRAANNQVYQAIKKATGRLAGFATAPMSRPAEAAVEFRRAVTELGFVGALVDNHDGKGGYFDGEEYDAFWAVAEELDVPVYLHPTWPSDDMAPRFQGNFDSIASNSLGSSGWGWHADTGLHVLRLFASGLFDRRPKLKIIAGHMGEMLPFMLQRIERLSGRWSTTQKNFTTVYRENIWITTSGVWSLDPLRCILASTPIDHILYSIDYPFTSNEVGLAWFKELEASGLVSQEELDAIAYKNAEKLLRVKV
ncbi:putative metal-dependent hydrolase [Triangularia setosa]|uniref:Metal-dependent hydrolase n=1 Tax=Triangularia setosa TaxID=2587417 RepID=A0AAN7AA27_9PEZI|nr:putative metal-dependent hydrolase [Podospora setosa]